MYSNREDIVGSKRSLWYYGTMPKLGAAMQTAIIRYRKRYSMEPTHIWFSSRITDSMGKIISKYDLVADWDKYLYPGYFSLGTEDDA